MPYATGQTVRNSFTVANLSGPVNADSTPTGAVRKGDASGVTTLGTTVTVTNNATGDYTASFTMPTPASGDTFELIVTAVVAGVSNVIVFPVEHNATPLISANPFIRA